MQMGSLFIVVVFFAVLVIAAGGFYLYTRTRSDTPLFTPRVRRLAFIERAHLDGGRKLLLVRRDDVEHLILVGGPIDLVVETGIRPESLKSPAEAEDNFADAPQASGEAPRTWEWPDITLGAAKTGNTAGPSLSLSPDATVVPEKNGEAMLELTPLQEAKSAS
ncbi:MAG: hypothetical protein WCD20_01595 [Rhodomicrobium sp.]